ncbi:hypothetical protein EDC30_104271 [Paucimonas lemoignei]|uniref:Uncharacterized protein n=1 Tax=Paucimonas lemoignei TaxID=29443 RepID=A0A4R3HW20_PAULE|nr:hypothetical protein EDC30_104271 [Paucimonas lemoignei]
MTDRDEQAASNRVVSTILIRFHSDAVSLGACKPHATLGVDCAAVSVAPGGESDRIDVSFDDDVSLADISLASLFGLILPLQECARQLVPVGEHGAQRVVVAFAIPGNADRLKL